MFERLMAEGLKRAEARRARKIATLAERAAQDVPPGVRVAAAEEGVILSGQSLRRRWLNDARLRALGLLLKETGR